MRTCGDCGKPRPDGEFAWKIRSKGLRQSKCRECQKKYGKKWYHANRKKHVRDCVKWRELAKQRVRELFYTYLSEHPCIECGESDPVVLEFAHRDRSTKEFTVGEAIPKGLSLDKVRREISKCFVLCANCHRRATAREGGWWKLSRSSSG